MLLSLLVILGGCEGQLLGQGGSPYLFSTAGGLGVYVLGLELGGSEMAARGN